MPLREATLLLSLLLRISADVFHVPITRIESTKTRMMREGIWTRYLANKQSLLAQGNFHHNLTQVENVHG